MFSGIVERVGRVERVDPSTGGAHLTIRAGYVPALAPGASVSVNGVCLTVERSEGSCFIVTAVPETLRKTTLVTCTDGSRVNLELPLKVGDTLGGHWVQGHVDARAAITSRFQQGADVLVGVEIPGELRAYVAARGSIAMDGTSLTVAAWRDPVATVALVPYTLEHTIADEYRVGQEVNLEVDILARYLERLLAARETGV